MLDLFENKCDFSNFDGKFGMKATKILNEKIIDNLDLSKFTDGRIEIMLDCDNRILEFWLDINHDDIDTFTKIVTVHLDKNVGEKFYPCVAFGFLGGLGPQRCVFVE